MDLMHVNAHVGRILSLKGEGVISIIPKIILGTVGMFSDIEYTILIYSNCGQKKR